MTVTPIGNRRRQQQEDDQAQYERIKSKMAQAHGPSEIETVRPGAARLILDNLNSNNRPKKSAKIGEFADYMTADNWKLTGDTIKFSTLYLRDGQNRLEACVKANKSFTTHIVYGIDDRIFAFLDNGKTRSVSDAFAIAGIENHGTVAGAVRWLEKFRLGDLNDRSSLTQSAGLSAFRQYYNEDLMKQAVAAARGVAAADSTPKTLATALFYLFSSKDAGLAIEFFDAWASRNWGGRMSPMRKASQHIARLTDASNGRVHELARIKAWIAAWNLVRAKRRGEMKDFKWAGPSDTMPKIK